MRVNQSVELNIPEWGTADGTKLREALNVVPPGTPIKIRIHHNQGDRPWESSSFTISVEWEEER